MIANQPGTIPNDGLSPLLLNQRKVLEVTRLNKNLLYGFMQDGLFPFPVLVRQKIVRWTSTSILTHLESSQQTGHTFNGQGQAPPLAHHSPVTFQPLDSNHTHECCETRPFPSRLRQEEVLYMLSVSRSSFLRLVAEELLLRPYSLSDRIKVWYLDAIRSYVQSLPPAWHNCPQFSGRVHPVMDCRKGKWNPLNGKLVDEAPGKTILHVR